MFMVLLNSSEVLRDETGDDPVDITISTNKTVKRTVCLKTAAAFIAADVNRPVGGGTPRSDTSFAVMVHDHPQMGTWNCNPPKEVVIPTQFCFQTFIKASFTNLKRNAFLSCPYRLH